MDSKFVVLHIVGQPAPQAFHHSEVVKVTLSNDNNTVLLKGNKDPLPIHGSGQDIANGLGLLKNGRTFISFTPYKSREGALSYNLYPEQFTSVIEFADRVIIGLGNGQEYHISENRAQIEPACNQFGIFFRTVSAFAETQSDSVDSVDKVQIPALEEPDSSSEGTVLYLKEEQKEILVF